MRYRSLSSDSDVELVPYSFSCVQSQTELPQNMQTTLNGETNSLSPGSYRPSELPQCSGADGSSPADSAMGESEIFISSSDIENSIPVELPVTTIRQNARASLIFKAWAVDNKKWIQSCVEFSVTGALFDRILCNINAPFKAKTVKRNILKHANFRTEKYVCCRPHMLIARVGNETGSYEIDLESITCDICISHDLTPDLTNFEYLPLKPRIFAWFKSEKGYRDITTYLSEKLGMWRRSDEESKDGTYEEFFDGSWFRTIVDSNGGVDAVHSFPAMRWYYSRAICQENT